MLTLYTHISAVRRQAGKGMSAGVSVGSQDMSRLSWRPMNRAGDIIWNYLQKELARCAEELDIGTDDSFLEACAVAVLHTAPYIAWRMSRADAFFIPLEEEGSGEGQPSFAALVRESIVCLGKAWDWPGQLKGIINEHGRRRWMRLAGDPDPDRLFDRAERIERLLLNEVSLFRVREDAGGDGYGPGGSSREVEMMHQQFRDGLAAVWLCQRIGAMETPAVLEKGIFRSTGDKYALPLCWREKIGRYVLKFAAEAMDEREAALFWEAGRVYQPSAVRYAYTMLNLMSERSVKDGLHENDFRDLDFSGMDLRNISLFSYKKEGRLKLQLPHREDPGRMTGTVLARASFEPPGHTGVVRSVALSRDGKRVVSGGDDGTLRVWDLERMTCEKVLEGLRDEPRVVSLSGNGKRAVSGGVDGTVRVWDLETMTCEKVLEGHKGVVGSTSVSWDGKRAVSGGVDGTVRVWDLESMTCEKALEGHKGVVISTSVSWDGKRAVSGGEDKLVRVWDLENMICEEVLEGHWGPVLDVSVSSNGKLAVSSEAAGIVRIWNLDGKTCPKMLDRNLHGNASVSLSGDGKRAVSGRDNGTVCVWDIESMTCENVLEGYNDGLLSVSVSSDGKRAVSSCRDDTVRVWDLESMTCESVLEGHEYIESVSISGDGKRVASIGWDKSVNDGWNPTLHVWDLEELACKKELESWKDFLGVSVALSRDGKQVVGFGYGETVNDGWRETVCVWELESISCEKVLEGHLDGARDVSVSPDGKRAVSGGVDGTVRVWDLESMTCEKVLEGHEGLVRSVALSRDGKRAVSGGVDCTVRVWNLERMTCEKVLEGHKGGSKVFR